MASVSKKRKSRNWYFGNVFKINCKARKEMFYTKRQRNELNKEAKDYGKEKA